MKANKSSSNPILRRFFERSPGVAVAVLIALANIVFALANFPPVIIAGFNLVLAILVLLFLFIFFQMKTYSSVISTLRKPLSDYLRLIMSEEEGSPLHLMRWLGSQHFTSGQPQQVWDVQVDKTAIIHNLIFRDLNDWLEAIIELQAVTKGTTIDAKPMITSFCEDTLRLINDYHNNVVRPLLEMRKEKVVSDDSLRQTISKFTMLYDDTLKEIQKAREKANSVLNLKVDVDIKRLLLPHDP